MSNDKKNTNEKGKAGQAGKWTATGFQPSKPQPTTKKISLLDILLGKK